MSDSSSHPGPEKHVPLTVLTHSGKVEQLKQEPPIQSPPNQESVITRFVDVHLSPRQKMIKEKVIDTIKGIFDPEIPVNIYELGLIYRIDVSEEGKVKVKMTLTAPACPVAGTLPGEVEKKIENIPEVKSAEVELVWEPQWSKEMMSEAARLDLGLM